MPSHVSLSLGCSACLSPHALYTHHWAPTPRAAQGARAGYWRIKIQSTGALVTGVDRPGGCIAVLLYARFVSSCFCRRLAVTKSAVFCTTSTAAVCVILFCYCVLWSCNYVTIIPCLNLLLVYYSIQLVLNVYWIQSSFFCISY